MHKLPVGLKLITPWEIVTMTALAYTTKKVNFIQVEDWRDVSRASEFVQAVYHNFFIDHDEKFVNARIMKYTAEDGRNKKALKLFQNGKMHLTGRDE